ncbi:MAG: hypothetical protein K0R38_7751 [Polyangiaceae bacterium]|nr:hypothetical protein [Polyangiaceae bacterium]
MRAVPEAAELLRAEGDFELLRDVPEAADFLRAEGGFELLRDVPEVELLRGAEFELLRAGPELRGRELAGAAPVALGAAALPAFGAALCFLFVCLATLPPEGVVPAS